MTDEMLSLTFTVEAIPGLKDTIHSKMEQASCKKKSITLENLYAKKYKGNSYGKDLWYIYDQDFPDDILECVDIKPGEEGTDRVIYAMAAHLALREILVDKIGVSAVQEHSQMMSGSGVGITALPDRGMF